MVYTLLPWWSTPGHGLVKHLQFHALFPTAQGLQTCHWQVGYKIQWREV